MALFLVRRLASLVLVLFAISVLVFLIFFATPGVDPARRLAGRNPDPATIAQIKRAFGLDRPLPVRYALMMKHMFISRDLVSYSTQTKVIPQLVEATPVALASRGEGLVLLDARGRILPFDPLRSAPDLPLAANGDAVVTGVLARVRDSDPDLFARIGAAWRVGPDVVLEVGGRRLWFGAQVSAEDIRAVTAVEQALARSGRPYQELDGRFAGQVIVRRTRA